MHRILTLRIPAFTAVSLPRLLGGVVLAALSAISSSGLHSSDEAQTQVQFPSGYREWAHVKSGVIGPEFQAFATEGGIHHIYANKTALTGFKDGTFEDGSILVYDLLSLSEKGGIGTEGARRRIDVMVKDAKRFPASGGWGFGRFMGDDRERNVLTSDVKTCYQCHEKRKTQGFVFSELRK